jgi:hypothetical protein
MPKFHVTVAAQRAHREGVRARAAAKAADLAPLVKELRAAGVTSLNGIAEALNTRGIPKAAGRRHWYATQVARVLKRLTG